MFFRVHDQAHPEVGEGLWNDVNDKLFFYSRAVTTRDNIADAAVSLMK
jgi:hypothetical protein